MIPSLRWGRPCAASYAEQKLRLPEKLDAEVCGTHLCSAAKDAVPGAPSRQFPGELVHLAYVHSSWFKYCFRNSAGLIPTYFLNFLWK